MKKPMSLLVMLAAASFATPLLAADASVSITSPADGAKLDSRMKNKISYEVAAGSSGNHVHLYVDGKEVAVLREQKGSYTMDALAPGRREICINVVNRAHTPIGVQKCITVTVE